MGLGLCLLSYINETIVERGSFKTEIQTRRGNLQVNLDRSQEASVSMSAAPVEGQKWKQASSHLEGKEEMEKEEEDPGEGHSSKPPMQKGNREK